MQPVLPLPVVGLSIRLTVGSFFRPSTCNFKSSSTIFNFHTKQSGYTIISFTKASITSSGMLCVEKLKFCSNPYFIPVSVDHILHPKLLRLSDMTVAFSATFLFPQTSSFSSRRILLCRFPLPFSYQPDYRISYL